VYDSEGWTLRIKDENVFRNFDRRIVRKICGPIKENGIWRSRVNRQLYKIYNEHEILQLTWQER
jgi:hypothetical protein